MVWRTDCDSNYGITVKKSIRTSCNLGVLLHDLLEDDITKGALGSFVL